MRPRVLDMTFEEMTSAVGLPAATFLYCVASALVPIVNAEVFLLGVAAMAPSSMLATVVVMATLGQMAAKAVLFLAGRGVLSFPLGRGRAGLEAVRLRIERWRSREALVLVSATTGIPPFYATSILAGSLGFPFGRFLVLGLAGRLVRFSVVVAMPPLVRWMAEAGRS